MRIACHVAEVDVEDVPGVVATCTIYRHEVESFGQTGASVRRCLAVMRAECPRGRSNLYTIARGSDLGTRD